MTYIGILEDGAELRSSADSHGRVGFGAPSRLVARSDVSDRFQVVGPKSKAVWCRGTVKISEDSSQSVPDAHTDPGHDQTRR